MGDKYDEQDIISLIKKMPKINDQMSKDELYQNISLNISRNGNRKNINPWKNKIIPIFSTALVIMILIVLIPSFFNSIEISSPKETEQTYQQRTSQGDNTANKGFAKEEEEEENTIELELSDRYVLYTDDIDETKYTIMYTAFPDDQLQYIIPVTFVLSDPSTINNNVTDLLEEEWGENTNILEGVHFEIDENNKQAFVQLPSNFSYNKGSAQVTSFTEVLSLMFTPIGINKIIFNNEVDLGPIGNVSELDLSPLNNAIYKVYQHEKDSKKFLIPIRQSDTTNIYDAIENMKEDEDSFHVKATVPLDINFEIDEIGDQLIVTFLNDLNQIVDISKSSTMIEAILMTAKSYGYSEVLFEGIPVDYMSEYDLAKPISVPDSVNPILK